MKTKKSMPSEQQIEAVKLMREIRAQLSEQYRTNPEQEDRDLATIRTKYHIRESTEA